MISNMISIIINNIIISSSSSSDSSTIISIISIIITRGSVGTGTMNATSSTPTLPTT